MRNAITLLLNAGKIVLPEALVVLKEVDQPVELAKLFLENYPDKHEVTQNDFHTLDKVNVDKKLPNKATKKIKFVKRKESKILATTKTTGSVPRRTKRSLNIENPPMTSQSKLSNLTKEHKQILKTIEARYLGS